jgi:phosphatidylserine/phosphatidylglycerophosphate/cardiolipin synthase-like enzyme
VTWHRVIPVRIDRNEDGRAKENIKMPAYAITEKAIISAMEEVLKRGVSVSLYIASEATDDHNYNGAISDIKGKYGNFRIDGVKNPVLHAKVFVSDTADVIIGNANPTQSGMYSNYEMGLHARSEGMARNTIMLLEGSPYE